MNLTVSNKAKTIPPISAQQIESRYQWLSLELAEPNLGVAPIIMASASNPSSTSTFVLTSNYIGTRGWASYDPLNFPFVSPERPDLETVGEAINEVIYRKPAFIYFAAKNVFNGWAYSNAFVEIGDTTTWAPATLSWGTNKANERAIDFYILNLSGANSSFTDWISGSWDFQSRVHPGFIRTQSIDHLTTQTFFITAQDWAGARATSQFTVYYRAPVYYGKTTARDAANTPNWFTTTTSNVQRSVGGGVGYDYNSTFSNEFYFIAFPAGYALNSVTVGRPGQAGAFPSTGITSNNVPIQNPFGVTFNYTVVVSEYVQTEQLIISYR
jgi:hypothetical protein